MLRGRIQHPVPRTSDGCSASLLLVIISLAAPISAPTSPAQAAESGDTYLARLVAKAEFLNLADERVWHLLLHYRKTWTGGYESEADGGGFFLAAAGKRDPQAELKATLTAFFAADDPERQHPQCQFPARYTWLKERLGFDAGQLCEQPCDRFATWRARLNPDSATLIFADAYLDNPPSMYGHTLLRLNRMEHQGGERLLDYVVNYSADTATRSGIIFAAKGLFGGYPGRFSTTPFYIKVQEYTNLESRDLWEYHLSFSAAQLDRLVMHLWELGSTHFDYYFLSENCSYQLLPLLEIADPSLHLTDALRPWVIPIDTVRLLLEQPGLVRHITYRPSHMTKMVDRRSRLDEAEVAVARAVSLRMDPRAQDLLDGFPEPRQAMILDAAYDFYRYREGFAMNQSTQSKLLERRILLRRRQLGMQPAPAVDRPQATPPHSGHRTGRVGLGFGIRRRSAFGEISFRPALQDLAGDHTGYLPNSHLEMFHLRLRLDDRGGVPSVEELALLEIISISPWDPWIRKSSWRAGTGLYRARDLDGGPAQFLYHGLSAGWGISGQTKLWRREVCYLLAEVDGGLGSGFRSNYRAGGGGRAGVLLDLTRIWRVHLEGSATSYLAGDRRVAVAGGLEQVITFSKALEGRFALRREGRYREAVVASGLYF